MILDPKKRRTNLYGNANTAIQENHGGPLGGGPIGAAPTGGDSMRIMSKSMMNFTM
jgi:hypothetical protein